MEAEERIPGDSARNSVSTTRKYQAGEGVLSQLLRLISATACEFVWHVAGKREASGSTPTFIPDRGVAVRQSLVVPMAQNQDKKAAYEKCHLTRLFGSASQLTVSISLGVD